MMINWRERRKARQEKLKREKLLIERASVDAQLKHGFDLRGRDLRSSVYADKKIRLIVRLSEIDTILGFKS